MRTKFFAIITALVLCLGFRPAQSATETIIHTFADGVEGYGPRAGVTIDGDGNLYGTTGYAGANGHGTIFKIAPNGDYSVLYAFTDGTPSDSESANLVIDEDGNLYGTQSSGGSAYNSGTLYQVSAGGVFKVLHVFTGGLDGGSPEGGVLINKFGELVGTTSSGGADGRGTVFKVGTDGAFKVLHTISPDDGAYPRTRLIGDTAGNLYGTTAGMSCGSTVFKLTPKRVFSVLDTFDCGESGYGLRSGLVRDGANNLYGTAVAYGANGHGTLYKITASGTFSVLYAFGASATDGTSPKGALVRDGHGNIYGTTEFGGANASGTVFRISPAGIATILHSFDTSTEGGYPRGGLTWGPKGILYGTTLAGGGGFGTVFKIRP